MKIECITRNDDGETFGMSLIRNKIDELARLKQDNVSSIKEVNTYVDKEISKLQYEYNILGHAVSVLDSSELPNLEDTTVLLLDNNTANTILNMYAHYDEIVNLVKEIEGILGSL